MVQRGELTVVGWRPRFGWWRALRDRGFGRLRIGFERAGRNICSPKQSGAGNQTLSGVPRVKRLVT